MVDSAANVYIYNDWRLITNYTEKPIRVGGFTADRVLLGKKKVKIRLAKKDGSEGLILTLINIFYILYSSLDLISFSLLNNVGYYYPNKDQILYD